MHTEGNRLRRDNYVSTKWIKTTNNNNKNTDTLCLQATSGRSGMSATKWWDTHGSSEELSKSECPAFSGRSVPHLRNVCRTGRSAYGLFRARRYHLERNRTALYHWRLADIPPEPQLQRVVSPKCKFDSCKRTPCSDFFLNYFFLNKWIVPLGFFPWKIRVAFPRDRQLRQSRATQLRCMVSVFMFT